LYPKKGACASVALCSIHLSDKGRVWSVDVPLEAKGLSETNLKIF
jgi:hypothetical protein